MCPAQRPTLTGMPWLNVAYGARRGGVQSIPDERVGSARISPVMSLVSSGFQARSRLDLWRIPSGLCPLCFRHDVLGHEAVVSEVEVDFGFFVAGEGVREGLELVDSRSRSRC